MSAKELSISKAVNGLTADIASCSITSAPIGPRLGKGRKPAAGPTNSSAQVLPLARSTSWPTCKLFTSADTSVTRPTPSLPGLAGNTASTPYLPAICSTSEGFIGAANTLTLTSPLVSARALSSFTSSTSAGLPILLYPTYFIFVSWCSALE